MIPTPTPSPHSDPGDSRAERDDEHDRAHDDQVPAEQDRQADEGLERLEEREDARDDEQHTRHGVQPPPARCGEGRGDLEGTADQEQAGDDEADQGDGGRLDGQDRQPDDDPPDPCPEVPTPPQPGRRLHQDVDGRCRHPSSLPTPRSRRAFVAASVGLDARDGGDAGYDPRVAVKGTYSRVDGDVTTVGIEARMRASVYGKLRGQGRRDGHDAPVGDAGAAGARA